MRRGWDGAFIQSFSMLYGFAFGRFVFDEYFVFKGEEVVYLFLST